MSAVLQPLPLLALTSTGTFSARSVLTRLGSVLSGYAVLYFLDLPSRPGLRVTSIRLFFVLSVTSLTRPVSSWSRNSV